MISARITILEIGKWVWFGYCEVRLREVAYNRERWFGFFFVVVGDYTVKWRIILGLG
jgi:hypothetical protein